MRPKPLNFVKETGQNGDPVPAGWFRATDQPSLMIPLEATIRAALEVVPALQAGRPSVGVLTRTWRGHAQNCLVVAGTDNPGTGEDFAVSKEPIYMRLSYDAQAAEILDRNPAFRENLLRSLKDDNCSEACFIEGTRAPSPALYLKCPNSKAGVFVKEEDFGKPNTVLLTIKALRDTLR